MIVETVDSTIAEMAQRLPGAVAAGFEPSPERRLRDCAFRLEWLSSPAKACARRARPER